MDNSSLEDILITTMLKIASAFAVRGRRRLLPSEIELIHYEVAQAIRQANILGRLDEAMGKPPPPRIPDPEAPAPGSKLRDTDPGFRPEVIQRRKSTRPPKK